MSKKDSRVFFDVDSIPERIDAIADELRARYARVATVRLLSAEHHAYEVAPINPRGCGFSFVLDQWLDLEVAGGRWELDWSEEGVALFYELTASIAAGRVVSSHRSRKTEVAITLEDGAVKTSTVRWLFGRFEPAPEAATYEAWVQASP